MFTDWVVLDFQAGKGGDGVIAWRREKYIPKGGPFGGNGGRGASVVLEADEQIMSLEWFRHRKKIKGENGQPGGPNRRQGRCGKELVLKVPCGTLVKNPETGELLEDLKEAGQRYLLCQGGKGGKGNWFFKSPTNQAPAKCTLGTEGEGRRVELELKLIADVGLVGFPNAGKSTFISQAAKVKVKIAPYPFTTLHPNLGYVQFDDFSRVLLADIPGIIRGAHANRGLGLEFLRHIERTKILLFTLDASGIDGRDPTSDFLTLRQELEKHDPSLLDKPYFVALNKMDMEESADHVAFFRSQNLVPPERLFEICAAEGEGVQDLLEALHSQTQIQAVA